MIAREVARLSSIEIDRALGAASVPGPVRMLVRAAAAVPNARLGRILGRFDADVGRLGLGRAARAVLETMGARVEQDGACPAGGAVLVVTNHPGAYDALAIMASLGRDDVAFLAAERAFLRAMPRLARHLVFVDDVAIPKRSSGLRRALDWLDGGRVLVQFGAGAIEPDARFTRRGEELLGEWNEGTGLLASHSDATVPCFVSGVHSPRAKRWSRWAERRGITTLAPLLQATLPGFRDVVVRVRLGRPIDLVAKTHRERTSLLRAAVQSLSVV
jgi:hypothetical protein